MFKNNTLIVILTIGTLLFAATASQASMRGAKCLSGLEDEGKSVTELVEKASIIAYMEPTKFIEDDTLAPFDGYYILSPLWELKPRAVKSFKLPGLRPIETFPQRYIDMTRTHDQINLNKIIGGHTGTITFDGKCHLAPRFMLGYRYLVLIGIESRIAFELINSPELDKWSLAVKEAALEDHRNRTGQ